MSNWYSKVTYRSIYVIQHKEQGTIERRNKRADNNRREQWKRVTNKREQQGRATKEGNNRTMEKKNKGTMRNRNKRKDNSPE